MMHSRKIYQEDRSRLEIFKNSLTIYLELPDLSILWIIEVLKGCSPTEFDQIAAELRPIYGQYPKWNDIPKIRGKLSYNSET
jgi:hypothetical protein